ncbi:MAG TPA: hypothetical protein VJB18_07390 [Burkholderiales bacterium]|nr:hypothetical protein [Burkholderiales bacterium]
MTEKKSVIPLERIEGLVTCCATTSQRRAIEGNAGIFMKREALPHVPDAWIDHAKTTVGYEIPLTRHFYKYQPPRPLNEIEADIKTLETDIVRMLGEVTN